MDEEQLTRWAKSCLRINHLNTLVQQEIANGALERATHLSERARVRAWTLFEEMIKAGGREPEGFRESGRSVD